MWEPAWLVTYGRTGEKLEVPEFVRPPLRERDAVMNLEAVSRTGDA